MAYTFDGIAKTITLTAQTAVDVRDVYSRWADWLAQSDNAKYLPAFQTVGGDIIDAASGTSIPIYAFLVNGWRVRPMEASHTLNVSGGVLLVQGGGDPFLDTIGQYVVRINYSQPVQAVTVSTGGGGGSSASDVWAHVIEAGFTAEQLFRLIVAENIGSATGLESGSPVFKSIDGTRDRITATYDRGSRTITSRDAT